MPALIESDVTPPSYTNQMDRKSASHRLLTKAGRLVLCALGLVFAFAPAAHADQLDQHNNLVNTFITQMHADPLVADCAAHGDFVANTSPALARVEFPPTAFDSAHATVTPWNDSFDEGKQRVKVDTIVTVDGIGIPQNSDRSPYDLKFRCGYVGNRMLAFSWNDPVPPARARSERSATPSAQASGKAKGKGKHSIKKPAGKKTTKSVSGKSVRKPASAGAKAGSTKATTKAKKTTTPAKKKTKSSR